MRFPLSCVEASAQSAYESCIDIVWSWLEIANAYGKQRLTEAAR
jgi:hypothetical protein